MAGTFFFHVVSPSGDILATDAEFVILPGIQGELGILPNHSPLIAAIGHGVIRYTVEGTEKKMAVSGGYAEVSHNQVTVLAETAELAETIDCIRARAAKERAEKRLAEAVTTEDKARAEESLKRAEIRLGAGDGDDC
jgi:F-type H+-transporting ATPase subunit epsilon